MLEIIGQRILVGGILIGIGGILLFGSIKLIDYLMDRKEIVKRVLAGIFFVVLAYVMGWFALG